MLFTLTSVVFLNTLSAQDSLLLSLEDVIRLAQESSPRSRIAQTEKQLGYFQYISFKSDFKPQMSIYGSAPVYNKEYYAVRQPDGTIMYQSIKQNNSNVGFSLNQKIPFSGGELSLNSDLSRFDDFKLKTKQYNGTPVYLRLSQPLFGINELRWSKKIEPLKFESTQKQYALEMQDIAQQTVQYYFDVLDAQSSMELAKSNLEYAKINVQSESKRVALGTTSEDKLLQLELQELTNQQDLENARYRYEIAQLSLKTFIGYEEKENLNLSIPGSVPGIILSIDSAFLFAKKHRPEFVEFEVKKLEALKEVARAKSAKQEVNLVASYGLNNAASDLPGVYRNPNDQQRFSLGFSIPIVDWGRRKARYNTAKAIEKLTNETNRFNELSLFQEITTIVKNIKLLQSNIALARQTDTVAQRRFTIALRLYQMGSISVTDLVLAQREKDSASKALLNALRSYWNAHYMIRKLTLFDFASNVSLLNEE